MGNETDHVHQNDREEDGLEQFRVDEFGEIHEDRGHENLHEPPMSGSNHEHDGLEHQQGGAGSDPVAELANNIVLIGNTTDATKATVSGFSKQLAGALNQFGQEFEHLRHINQGDTFAENSQHLQRVIEDFQKAGHDATRGTWKAFKYPIFVMTVCLLGIAGMNGYFFFNGYFGTGKSSYNRIYDRNAQALKSCVNMVRYKGAAYKCSIVVSPEDL